MRAWLGLISLMVGLAGASLAAAQDDTGGAGDPGDPGGTGGDPGGDTGGTGTGGGTGTAASGGGAAQQPPPPQVVVVRETVRDEPREEREEPRKPVFYMEGGFGYSYIDMRALDTSNFLPAVEEVQGSGYCVTVGTGFRLSFIQLGGRAALASYPNFEFGVALIEAGIRIVTPSIEPWFRVGIGYGWQGDANYETPGVSTTDVYGLAYNGAFGLDIFLNRIIAIGVGLEGDVLNLTRQRVDMGDEVDRVDFSQDGDAVGIQARLHAHIGLHI